MARHFHFHWNRGERCGGEVVHQDFSDLRQGCHRVCDQGPLCCLLLFLALTLRVLLLLYHLDNCVAETGTGSKGAPEDNAQIMPEQRWVASPNRSVKMTLARIGNWYHGFKHLPKLYTKWCLRKSREGGDWTGCSWLWKKDKKVRMQN